MNVKMGRVKAIKTREEKVFLHAQILSELNSFPPEERTLHTAAFYLKQLEMISNRQFEKYYERMRPLQLNAYKWLHENFKDFFTLLEYNIISPDSQEEGHREYVMNIYTFSKDEPGIMFRLFPPSDVRDIIPGEDMKSETGSRNNFNTLYGNDDTYAKKMMSWKSPIISPRVAIRELKKLMMLRGQPAPEKHENKPKGLDSTATAS